MDPALRLALFEPDIPQNAAAVLRTCARLTIPMASAMRSLNMAVPAAMVAAEALRQPDAFPNPETAPDV